MSDEPSRIPGLDLVLPVAPGPTTQKQRAKIANRQSRRLHEARMGFPYLPHKNQHEVEQRCVGCGTELSNYTDGCEQCANRMFKRAKRA